MSDNNNLINQELYLILGEIRGQLAVMADFIKRSDERQVELELRVRNLEHASAKIIGAAIALSALGSFLIQWATS